VGPGDAVHGTLVVSEGGGATLESLVVDRKAPPDAPPELAPGEAAPTGALFPSTPVLLAEGAPVTIGEGQDPGRWAVTFIYTRCPVPEYCPLVVTRFQALQQALPPGARLLAITMDPEYDSKAVLKAFAAQSGAIPGKWDFGRVPDEVLFGLAEKAGLKVAGKGTGIVHDLVLLILDEHGRLLERYHDMAWSQDEVVRLLTTP
ncbi:MAG: SCO family protein, partial [Myxococcota bacterium]